MSERDRRWLIRVLVGVALALLGFEAWRARQLPVTPRAPTVAEQLAAEIARNMRALEQDLVAFLLAEGSEIAAVSRRSAEVQHHFGWAHPLFIVDRQGEVLAPPAAAQAERDATTQQARGQRFANLLRRARSQATLVQAVGAAPPPDDEKTVRFAAPNARSGIHVLLNLEPENLWAVFRAKPTHLKRLLAPGLAVLPANSSATIRLVDPRGRIAYTSRRGTEHLAVTKAAPIETAPQWAVEVLGVASQGPDSKQGSKQPSWLRLAAVVLLLASAGVIRWRRKATLPTSIDNEAPATNRLLIGDATVDFDRFVVHNGDAQHPLTDREVALLQMLVAAPNQVVQRDRLLDEIWGYSADVTSRTVDTFLYRLRQKIEADPKAPRHFLTVRGAGYRFVP